MGYARKMRVHNPVGSFWVDIARQVTAYQPQRGAGQDFSATID
jgi:hypothetical protein